MTARPRSRQGVSRGRPRRLVGDVADLAKRLDEIIGRVAVILDNQKAHGPMSHSKTDGASRTAKVARRPTSPHHIAPTSAPGNIGRPGSVAGMPVAGQAIHAIPSTDASFTRLSMAGPAVRAWRHTNEGVASGCSPPPLPTLSRQGRRIPGSRVGIRRGRALRPVPRVRPPAGATNAGGSPHFSGVAER